jgi:glutathione S-transferase
MKLYLNPLSPNVRRVTLTEAQLGLSLEHHILDFAKGEHKAPEYLKLNPNGMVPTLVDGDLVLTESRVIMQYLATKKPESGLLPKDEKGRADVTRWQFWDASHFSPAAAMVAFERLLKPMFGLGETNPARVEEGLGNFRRFGGVLNEHLGSKKYIVGDALTIADLTIGSSLMYSGPSELPVAEFPNLQAWFSRITALESWKKTENKR